MSFYNPYDIAITLTAQNKAGETYNLKPMPRTNFELLDGYVISNSSCAQYPNVQLLPAFNILKEAPIEKEKGDK
jgi:hypothetical protein